MRNRMEFRKALLFTLLYVVVGLAGLLGLQLFEPQSALHVVSSYVLAVYIGHTAYASTYWLDNIL